MVPGCTIIYGQQADIKCCRAVSVRIENAAPNIQGLVTFCSAKVCQKPGSLCVCTALKGNFKKARKDALDSSVFFSWKETWSLWMTKNVLKIKEWLREKKKKEGKQSKGKLIDVRHGRVVRRQSTFQNKQVRELFPYLGVFSIKIELFSNTSGVGATVKGWLKLQGISTPSSSICVAPLCS